MIDGSLVTIGFAGVVAVAWGSCVSALSAVRGPQRTLPVLRVSRGASLIAVSVSLLVIRPLAIGTGIAYVAVVMWWISRRAERSLRRALDFGPYELPPAPSRVAILSRTAYGLAGTAFAIAGVGSLLRLDQPQMWAATLVVAGMLLCLASFLAVEAWRQGKTV